MNCKKPMFLKPLHFCSAKIIPLVFDNSLSYYEQLCAFTAKLNDVIDYVNSMSLGLTEFYQMLNSELENYVTMPEYTEFKQYVLDFINNITIHGVGETIEPGTVYTYDDVEYTAGTGAEIFNAYEGGRNEAAGNYSHAEGLTNKALSQGSHVEGTANVSIANNGHAEGQQNIISGANGHAEGAQNTVSAANGHAEGDNNTASGVSAHAEGEHTTASGLASHASGSHTTAAGAAQTAIGSYNISHDETLTKTDDDSNTYEITKFPFIIGNGYYGTTTQTDVKKDALKIDCHGKIYVGNDTGGVDLKQFYDSFAVGSTENNYVLTASYSGGSGSYSWQPSQGGGSGGTVTTGSIIGIYNDNGDWSFNHSPYYSRAKQQNNIVVLEIYGFYQSDSATVVPVADPVRVLIANLSGVTLPDATIIVPALCTSATLANGNSHFVFEITTTGAIYLNYTSMVSFNITQGNQLYANISYVVDTV
ncbi:MAG: hypothetical protein J6Y71_06975 [Ruminococcus sp.]|nr:hypothetical protein [Ruminococcus sp.]